MQFSRLELSQYSLDASRRIMVAGLKGYERIREKAIRTGGSINRSEEEGAAERYKKKLLGKTSWFKKTKQSESDQSQEAMRRRRRRMTGVKEPAPPVTSVLFVPKTQDSGLATRLMEAEHRLAAITKERVRVVERGGKSVLQLLHTDNPFAGAPCGRDTCIPCNYSKKDKRENCDKRGILYETFCIRCQKLQEEQGLEATNYIYVGKSHRAMADRGAEHLDDAKKEMEGKPKGSHMARHALEMHPGEEPEFGMTIVRTYTSAFTLAMGEVIRILYRSKEKGVVLLNSKAGDFASYSLPRLAVRNWEEEQEAPSNRDRSKSGHRYESGSGRGSDLSRKSKHLKTPCLNVKRSKTRPASKKILRSNGT